MGPQTGAAFSTGQDGTLYKTTMLVTVAAGGHLFLLVTTLNIAEVGDFPLCAYCMTTSIQATSVTASGLC